MKHFFRMFKGQLISKANCQALSSSKKRTYEFVFTSMRCVFVCFLEEIEDSIKAFRNYLTFNASDFGFRFLLFMHLNIRDIILHDFKNKFSIFPSKIKFLMNYIKLVWFSKKMTHNLTKRTAAVLITYLATHSEYTSLQMF